MPELFFLAVIADRLAASAGAGRSSGEEFWRRLSAADGEQVHKDAQGLSRLRGICLPVNGRAVVCTGEGVAASGLADEVALQDACSTTFNL
jgi:hypothetical protein